MYRGLRWEWWWSRVRGMKILSWRTWGSGMALGYG
jgi:hypothetical protein